MRLKILFIIVFLFPLILKAQLNCNFGINGFSGFPQNITGGCEPMLLTFNDSSQIFGNAIPYRSINNGDSYNSHYWEFSCNNIVSTQKNPSLGFFQPGNCCITLTVTLDGINYCMVTKCIDIFPKPEIIEVVPNIDSTLINCMFMPVCFSQISNSINGSIVSWSWDFGDGQTSALNNPCHYYISNIQDVCYHVTLTVTNSNGCSTTKIYPDLICMPESVTGNFTFTPQSACVPAEVCFSANSNGAANFLWIFNDGDFGFGTMDTICHHYFNSGTYFPTLVISDFSNPPCSYLVYPQDSIVILESDSAYALFGTDKEIICPGESIAFFDSSYLQSGNIIREWNWNFGDGNTSDEQNPVHIYNLPGEYTVELNTEISGCASFSATKDVIVFQNPTPAIFQDGQILQTETYTAYQWYWNGSLIDSAENQLLELTENGEYYVMVTDSNGCSGFSETIQVLNVGINQNSKDAFKIYPNPFSNEIYLELKELAILNIELRNILNKIIYQSSGDDKNENAIIPILPGNIPSGIYFLHLETVQQKYIYKLLKI